jgi:tellurite methyltransferase
MDVVVGNDELVRDGGYDEGYKSVPCFWGTEPGSIVRMLTEAVDLSGSSVLDLGAGEGKNAYFLAALGASVEAWEISEQAMANGRARPDADTVRWRRQDAVELASTNGPFDAIIAYGLMHCLRSEEISQLISDMQRCTAPGGFNILVAFNDRSQDIAAAHPGFVPTLVGHDEYLRSYEGWEKWHVSDSDLVESHPHNNIEHTHSMTRILARNVLDG